MIKVEKIDVWGFEHAIRGMRNPMNSWDRSDSTWRDVADYDEMVDMQYVVGEKDLELMRKLYKAGSEHRKYARQIFVSMDITAPIFWLKQLDTYKIGTTSNSTSFMHKGLAEPYKLSDFNISFEISNSEHFFDVPCDIKKEDEIWAPIKDFESYEISNTGRVRSIDRSITDINGVVKNYKSRELHPSVNSSNYKKVCLKKNGKLYNRYIHRLLAETFIPNPNNYTQINHKDGNKYNNNLSNLEWVTVSENSIHAVNMGFKGASYYNRYKVANRARRFSFSDIITIGKLYEMGLSKQEIANLFKCTFSIISNMLRDKNYVSQDIDRDLKYEDCFKIVIDELNLLRESYLQEEDIDKKEKIWNQILWLLPESYNQRRTITMSYENVFNIINQRSGHRLDEWVDFVEILKDLPYVREIIGEKPKKDKQIPGQVTIDEYMKG